MNYNSFDDVMKREDYEWKKFNFNNKSRRTSVKTSSPIQAENSLTDRRLSLKLKKKSSMVVNKKVYKDIEIPQSEKNFTSFDSHNHLKVIFIGPSQTGKSTLCGQIQNLMGQVKKAEMNKC